MSQSSSRWDSFTDDELRTLELLFEHAPGEYITEAADDLSDQVHIEQQRRLPLSRDSGVKGPRDDTAV